MIQRSPLLIPQQRHAEVVRKLRKFELVSITSNDLPLFQIHNPAKVGFNLELARSNPAAIEFVTDFFFSEIVKHPANRLVEVSGDGEMACFFGPLALRTQLPYVSISGKNLGYSTPGENVLIVDGIISDGRSQIKAYKECARLELNVLGILVLITCDEQPWKENLENNGISTTVFQGLRSEDIRFELKKKSAVA